MAFDSLHPSISIYMSSVECILLFVYTIQLCFYCFRGLYKSNENKIYFKIYSYIVLFMKPRDITVTASITKKCFSIPFTVSMNIEYRVFLYRASKPFRRKRELI